MVDLYISGKQFFTCLVESKSESKNSKLTNLLLGDKVRVLASDDSLWEKLHDKESEEGVWARTRQLKIYSGVESASTMLARGRGRKINGEKIRKIKSGTASSIYISSFFNTSDTENLACNPGVLALGDNSCKEIIEKYSYRKKTTLYPIYDDESDENEVHKWSELVNHYSGLPINSIIINDNYAHKEKFSDISKILRSLLGKTNYSFQIEILILFGLTQNLAASIDNQASLRNIASKYIPFIKSISAEYKINCIIEFVFCPNLGEESPWPLYDYTHNRYVITNYTFFSGQKSLEAFNNGSPRFLQNIEVASVFSDNESRKEHHIYLKQIRKEILKASENKDANIPYKCFKTYVQEGNSQNIEPIDISSIKNKLIMELQEGDNCYHLIVPNDNDWIRIHPSVKAETFSRNNFRQCVCAHTKEELDEKAKKIKGLFDSIPKDKLASNEDKVFYRIMLTYPSDLLTIDYRSSEDDGAKFDDQLQYSNNYFKDENYTVTIANQICLILGIPPMVQIHK